MGQPSPERPQGIAALGPAEPGGPAGEDRPRRRRNRLLATTAFLVVGIAVAAATALALDSGPASRTSQRTAIPPGDTTTTVTRRTLVEHTQVDGTLGYGGTFELYDRLAGTFTWLPGVGKVIRRGGTLFRIDDQPVVLMYGTLPAYRTLKIGVSDGPDIAELNANLVALGFDPDGAITNSDEFSEATAEAVRRWQSHEGLPETGKVELGRVVFAPGARRVTAVHVSLGEDPPAASKGKQPAAKKPGDKEKGSKEPDAKKPAAEGKKSKEPDAKKPGDEGGGGESGADSAAPVAVLGSTSTRQLVQLKVKASQQQLARVGESVPVTLPSGSVVYGHITNVGTVAEAAESGKGGAGEGGGGGEESGSEEPTIAVTLALDHPVARLDKAPVTVELVKSIRRGVLAVSAAALVATAGGGYAVEALEGTQRVELAVTPGIFVDGYVQIEGPGIRAGLKVTEPRE